MGRLFSSESFESFVQSKLINIEENVRRIAIHELMEHPISDFVDPIAHKYEVNVPQVDRSRAKFNRDTLFSVPYGGDRECFGCSDSETFERNAIMGALGSRPRGYVDSDALRLPIDAPADATDGKKQRDEILDHIEANLTSLSVKAEAWNRQLPKLIEGLLEERKQSESNRRQLLKELNE